RYPRASSPPPPPGARAAAPRAPTTAVRGASGCAPVPPPASAAAAPRPPGVPVPATAAAIHVRFRRGDDWAPARLRSLGLKGAYLACGAPPRLHDDVHVAIGLGPLGTVMRGSVVHVTSPDEAARTGAAGFGVLFPAVDSPSRRQLKELLRVARQKGIALEPPPPRRAVRFPVRWPVQILLPNQDGLDAAALDVSAGGMFLTTRVRLPAGALEFLLPPERCGAPIRGRARAVREVPWKLACARGLHSGFGMEIVDFARDSAERYDAFVQRVRARVERRILVGGAPERVEELVAGLGAAGYTASGTTDARALVRAAECDARPPDAVVVDASLATAPDVARRMDHLFALREVPVVRLAGEPAPRARDALDDLLAIPVAAR
ncbi:MAG: PilZ domain-containing protein, partial [Deltaproteobacteria bacterium]